MIFIIHGIYIFRLSSRANDARLHLQIKSRVFLTCVVILFFSFLLHPPSVIKAYGYK